MSDKIKEVGKILGKTKRDSEAALRRYNPVYGRAERIRDIFDDVVPFEMEFQTKKEENIFRLNVNFNKPPPMNNCQEGYYTSNCQDFVANSGEGGAHLFNVGETYFPLTVTVYVDGVQYPLDKFSEYDATQGLVYVVDLLPDQIVSICYLRTTWTYICLDTDPYEGTPDNYANIRDSEFANNLIAEADTNPTTQVATSGSYSNIRADFYASIAEHDGYVQWLTHLGTLDNLPGGPSFGSSGSIGFPDPSTSNNIDWSETRITFDCFIHCGENAGQPLGFFGNASETAFASIEMGYSDTIALEITMDHDDRGGIFPFLGDPKPPRGFFTVKNWGNTYDGNDSFIDNGLTQSGTFSIPFNKPFTVTATISYKQRLVTVQVGGQQVRFTGNDARFKFNAGGNVTLNFAGTSYLTDPGTFFAQITNLVVVPCGFSPI